MTATIPVFDGHHDVVQRLLLHFDGAMAPQEIGDVAGLPRLVAAMRADGYDKPLLRKLCHGNWFPILERTWKNDAGRGARPDGAFAAPLPPALLPPSRST